MASICCSPPESLVPCAVLAALAQVGEHLVDLVDAHAALADPRRQHQVLLDGEAGEDGALLGAVADPQVRDPVGGPR